MSERIVIVDGNVDTAVIAGYERSRRALVRRGIALGGGLVAASAIPFLIGVRRAFAQAGSDVAVLEAAVALEQHAAFAYASAADGGKLGESTPVARLFAEQEQEHADALTGALRRRGGSPPAKPSGPGDVPGLAEAIRGDAVDITNFAVELETTALAAYHDAVGKLNAPELLATVAGIMGNQAQHLVVLRQALGENPAPRAFVTGAPGGA